MLATQQGPEGNPPGLSVLQLEMHVNTTDRQLLTNLQNAKSLGLPELSVMAAHPGTLAIVGSGPSLRDTWRLIPPDCEVMALNGAYRFLRERGRTPEYFAMLDAREVNVNFLTDPAADSVFLLASQCHPSVFERLEGHHVTLFHLGTPTTRRVFPDADPYVGGGGTIGLSALGLAVALGYRTVILYGYDSSFDGEAHHAQSQPQNVGQSELDVWVQDRKYRTTHAMASQTMDFFPFYEAIRKFAPNFSVHLVGKGLFYDFVTTNNHPPSRERELAKYRKAYQHDDYRMNEGRRSALDQVLDDIRGESWLDVSTGRGELLELARQHGFSTVKGTETVPDLCGEHVTQAVLPEIPFPDHSFDVVSLIEVIEHLLPDDIRPALDELTRLARKHILISAAVYPHWYGGVNMHPSARPQEEWEALFREVWGDKVRRVGDLGLSPCWRVDL
jgi:SAM-dependent methyltransferase